VVIIDTPAGAEYADAQTIAVRAGAAVMLARKNQSSITDIAALTGSLQQSGATLVGSILNDG
jgi:protein-tyrosine kinase